MTAPAPGGGFAQGGVGDVVTFAAKVAYKDGEDRVAFDANVKNINTTPNCGELHAFFAVMDAHKGSEFADAAKEKLLSTTLNRLPQKGEENTLPGRSKKALEEAVARACEALETQVKYSGCCGFGAPPESGTTVCAVFIRTAPPGAYPDLGGGQAPLQVVTENIGDSRAVMFPLPKEQGVMGQRSPQSGAAATAAATAGASESTGSTSKPRKREASQSAKAMAEVYRIDTAASTLDPSVALSGEGPFPPPAPEALALGVALTRDHRAETNAEEVVRVKSAGGLVSRNKRDDGAEVGPLRVYPGGYSITRSMGDLSCPFLICAPEARQVTVTTVPDEGCRLIIANDGLFSAVKREAIRRVACTHARPEGAAAALVHSAVHPNGPMEDIAVIVVDIPPAGSRGRGQGGLQQQEDPPAPEVPASLEAAAGANRDPDERDGTFWSSEATVGNPQRRPLRDLYSPGEVLGKGHFATVSLVRDSATGEVRAMKSAAVTQERRGLMSSEVDTLIAVSGRHPVLPTVFATFEEAGSLHIVTDACSGGSLLDWGLAQAKSPGSLEEKLRGIFRQLLEGVAFLHSLAIVHRDIKPENILLRDAEGPGAPRLMLVDFGSALFCLEEKRTTDIGFHGTGIYAAPEIFVNAPHGLKVDVFSVGVTLFVLLAGHPPQKQVEATMEVLQRGEAPGLPAATKGELREFISALICPKPSKRPTAKAALDLPWLRNVVTGEEAGAAQEAAS